jgi:DNA-binding NtrC family response regulator
MMEHNTIRYIRASRKMTEHDAILYMSDQANCNNSVLAALKETGCEVVSTNSSTVGIAMFYVMHSVAAVVLDKGTTEQAGFDVAQSLRQIRPNVPVIELCCDQTDCSPSSTSKCVSSDKLPSALQSVLAAEPVA